MGLLLACRWETGRKYAQGAECDAVATAAAGFVEQRTPKSRVHVNCLLRHQGARITVEIGDSARVVLVEALVQAQVCQVRDEEGIFLLPPEVSADGVSVRDETTNFVKRSQRHCVVRTDPGRESISLPHDECVVMMVDSEPCK